MRDQGAQPAMLAAIGRIVRAARESSDAMLAETIGALHEFDRRTDAVLFFKVVGDELQCRASFGARSRGYERFVLRRDHPRALPALAARNRHHVVLRDVEHRLIPGDRAALAIPMCDDGAAIAAFYLSSCDARALTFPAPAIGLIGHVTAAYLLACARERDRYDALHDGLTGLLTPRAFRATLRDEVARSTALGKLGIVSLWFVDTDGFKSINDRRGHAAGDRVLQQMASLLQSQCVPHVDVAGRNGGDEFCLLVPSAQKGRAIARARRFLESVRAHDFGIGQPLTASIGVASIPFDARTANGLLEIADAAMYHSKRTGRDRVSFAIGDGRFAEFP